VATVAELGIRTLRRLGFTLVAPANQDTLAAPMGASDVAALVLRNLGIPVQEANRPAPSPPVSQATVAAAALRLLGIGQATSEAVGTVTEADIATRALWMLGVNPIDLGTDTSLQVTYTRVQVAQRVLLKLAVIASDETPAAGDLSDTVDILTSVHERLTVLGFVNWYIDGIPEQAVEAYIILAANLAAPQYGKPASGDAFKMAEEMLRQQAMSGQTAQSRAVLKVQAVHADLAASGLIGWTSSTIPAGAAEHYAEMVVQAMAPMFGQQSAAISATGATQGMNAYNAAEAHIRRMGLSGPLGLSVAEDKVGAAHEALNALGLVSWPLTAIPVAYVPDYAQMAATLISAFALMPRDAQTRQVDNAAWDAAIERVRKGALIVGAQERALAKVQAVHGELDAMGMVSWPLNAIPGSMADAYATAATTLMGAEAGKMPDPKEIATSYQRIKMLAMNGPAGQALAAEKVTAVHQSLQARGKVRWTVYDIPTYASEPYVFMAATWLAPELDMKPDPAWWTSAEIDLARIVSLPSSHEPVRVDYF
jgi:hypothetical protein